jgi:aspartate/methionine/tyrosine aminotransferase
MNTQSIYMQWAKMRPTVKYDLALSGILNLPFPELEATIEDIDLNGDNSYGYAPLVEALAEHCRVTPDKVVTISGGTSMANHLAMAAAIEHGARVKRFAGRFEDGFQIHLADLEQKVTPHTRLIVLTNLHNPSSALTDENTLRHIGEIADRSGARVLVDEVYLDAMFEAAPASSIHLGPQFIGTSSLTKGYGLSGLRCGWILAEPQLAERMRLLHDIFGSLAPHPAERLSVVALQKLPKFISRARNILDANRAVLSDFIDSREELNGSVAQFGTTCFPRLEKGNVDELWTRLHEKYDTAFVPGRFFEMPQHVRLGLCAEPELFAEGVRRFGQALDELGNSH